MSAPWSIVVGDGPLVAAAIHNGHTVREEVSKQFAISEETRLREEDPFTGDWTQVAPTRIVGHRSRFEVDLNRPRPSAVYRKPEDAWGLEVWRDEPSPALVERSLAEYDEFYKQAHELLSKVEAGAGRFVVFDLHTYNHLRKGPTGPPADPDGNPEVNIGTGAMDRVFWSPVVDRFIEDLRTFDFMGRSLDVRENVKFRGGHFSHWINETFPGTGCDLAIEFKKFFMNEWTGALDAGRHQAILRALQSTVPGVLEELAEMGRTR